jgi:SAM-dependent methyltransferase
MNAQPILQSDCRPQLHTFLDGYGTPPAMSAEARDRRLAKLMKPKRTKQLTRAYAQYLEGRLSFQRVIDCFETPEEANLFINVDCETAAAVGAALYQQMVPFLHAGCSVADLGCFTAGFLAWIAPRHPECTFVGFDCHPKAVQFANQLAARANTTIQLWDYELSQLPQVEPFDLLFCSCGVDFGIIASRLDDASPGAFSPDVMRLRDSGAYAAVLGKLQPCFTNWRAIAKPGARLWTVLRLASTEFALAAVDAAHQAGWALDLASSLWITVHKESLPLMSFVAQPGLPLSDDSLITWYGQALPAIDEQSSITSPEAAIGRYWGLADKQVISIKDFHDPDGHTMRLELGRAAEQAYLLQRATTGFTHFKLLTAEQAASLQLDSITWEELPLYAESWTDDG